MSSSMNNANLSDLWGYPSFSPSRPTVPKDREAAGETDPGTIFDICG